MSGAPWIHAAGLLTGAANVERSSFRVNLRGYWRLVQ